MTKTWWKEAVVYQIYPRSFKDSNNDGVGDLQGIIQKLDYIKSLGVDVIWLCPVYKSPNDDNGYDISDYRDIMDEFGTMADFDELLAGIHQRGMKLLMDLVVNHSSDEHEWFEESRKSKDNPYRDYYIWKSGKNNGPPNDWEAFFGGSAWQYDATTEEYYLHLFTTKQPDLNWENPKVRKEVRDVVKFWFDKGIDGFRMDVISLISKGPEYSDMVSNVFEEVIQEQYANGPRIHEFLKELNTEVLSKYDIMTVGEGPGITLDHGLDYVGEDRAELNMVFHFDHMFLDMGPGGKFDPQPYSLVEFKNIFNRWDEKLKGKGWGSIFLDNHDFPRMVSRYANDDKYHDQSAKLLATLLMTMRGTPYVYQGDEIGMTNVAFPSPEYYRDIETLNYFKSLESQGKNPQDHLHNVHKMGRDNARTPMQWNKTANAGFSEAEPWIQANPNYEFINVEDAERGKYSILNFYRKVIQFRKENSTLVYGDYESIENRHEQIYAYRRWDETHEFLVVLNFSDQTVDFNAIITGLELLIYNYGDATEDFLMRPWEAKVFRVHD
ncbi:MAG: glucohydrolase [Cytophagales bacterium CG12_big_fil_rev_8_21_14_0_65_40_12]|nr:MAG: glucohydrolase [Cytophagales bacterium CG12_big_fil_rev_8_21_14_0_65_40_12]PIW04862.1 MAG: glucohydrolase [Cytophagales bacterium CG17_big_fil_post_rev_8_21_14_2_50_40_13]